MKKILFFISLFTAGFFQAAFNPVPAAAQNAKKAIEQLRISIPQDINIIMPVPADNTSVAVPVQKTDGAIILTVPGIKASSLWSYIFGKGDGSADDIYNRSEDDAWLKQYFGFKSDKDFQEFKKKTLAQAERISRSGEEDLYLETPIHNIPGIAERNIEVKTFIWSRNALDSAEAAAKLMEEIKDLSAKAAREGKKFHIFSHSWGTLLSHTALHRLARSNANADIATWVTCGSPLIPANKIVRKYVVYMVENGNLEKDVAFPKNVRRWVNVWASRDLMSNTIPASTVNIEADERAAFYEDRINDNNPLLATSDWGAMRNPISWHSSYHEDFHAYLSSAGMPADIFVFRPHIQPEFTLSGL